MAQGEESAIAESSGTVDNTTAAANVDCGATVLTLLLLLLSAYRTVSYLHLRKPAWLSSCRWCRPWHYWHSRTRVCSLAVSGSQTVNEQRSDMCPLGLIEDQNARCIRDHLRVFHWAGTEAFCFLSFTDNLVSVFLIRMMDPLWPTRFTYCAVSTEFADYCANVANRETSLFAVSLQTWD